MMKSKILIFYVAVSFIFLASAGFAEEKADLRFSKIEELTGTKGKFNEKESVFKISFPRTDVVVSVDGLQLDPFMGLTSWTGFQDDPKGGMMIMGDLVLFQDEVNPVMSVLLDNGLEVTALHNHFFYDDPKVFFMHIGGTGDMEKLASAVRKALDKVKEIRSKFPQPAHGFGELRAFVKSSITPQPIEDIFGEKGEAKNGMFKVVIGRKTKMPCGCDVGKTMGVNTWAAFAGNDQKAFVDGDVAMFESEIQSVLKILRANHINIVAIHNHMSEENPKVIFLHYWGMGSTTDLAKALKSALDVQGK
ncbi:MAG: DUF1259 domain-containing protein [Candidatus Omnitrophica bacterium]|nr:DUF1259 domain-containing protein [Candidatus Omnitrophota bacterium]